MREALAALAHEQWSGWIRYMLGRGVYHVDGSITLPARLVAGWTRQMRTPYDELSEDEKDSDRREADRVIEILEETE